jgi:hypothetical protein
LADMLEDDNPGFNRSKFLDWCCMSGVEEST